MKDDPEREVAVFTEALKISIHERAAFLERSCGDNKDLRQKVEALLKAYDRIGSFLEEPPPAATDETD